MCGMMRLAFSSLPLLIPILLLSSCGPRAAPSPSSIPVARAVSAPPNSVSLAYASSQNGLLKGDDAGIWRWNSRGLWELLSPSAPVRVSAFAADPLQPDRMLAASVEIGVLRSQDGGQSWTESSHGLSAPSVTALALHSYEKDTLFAWVLNDGIFRSEDAAANWERMPDQGPPDPDVRGLVHSDLPGSMNTGWLYAVTPSGIYLTMDCF